MSSCDSKVIFTAQELLIKVQVDEDDKAFVINIKKLNLGKVEPGNLTISYPINFPFYNFHSMNIVICNIMISLKLSDEGL